MPPPTINIISFGVPETFAEQSIQPIHEASEGQGARIEKEFLMISEDQILNLIFDYHDSNKDEHDPAIFEYISMA